MGALNLLLLPSIFREIGPRALFHYLRYRLALRSGLLRRQTAAPPSFSPVTIRPVFPLPSPQTLGKFLGETERAQLQAEAESLRNGQFHIFGHFPVSLRSWDLGLPRRHWTEYEAGALRAEAFLPAHFPADIKFLWEPARWGWAFRLGRAYYLLGDERYAAAFWELAESFLDAHPPYLGPHWMNGQEVALRLLVMIWSAQVFASSAHSTVERLQRLSLAIAAHAHRILPTLDYALAQENNHLLSEAAALIAAARALPQIPLAARWENLGIRLFNRALERQINSYGEYIQQSTNYHRLMLDLALYIHSIAPDSLGKTARQNLARATHWLRSITDPHSGGVPNLGSNDGANFFLLTSCPFSDFRPTVQASARAFLGEQLPYSGPWDELSLWLGLPVCQETAAPEFTATHQSYTGLSDVLHAPRSWGYLRAGSFRSRLAHSDQLHFDLWWQGYNIARDAGTGYYNLPAPWDNPLTVARVHNLVLVDEQEPRRRLTRFLHLGWRPAWSRLLLPSEAHRLGGLEARYRPHPHCLHTRTIWVHADERWEVQDHLQPRRETDLHRYRLHWLLADGEWELQPLERQAKLSLQLPIGRFEIRLEANAPLRLLVVRAGEVLWGEGQARPYEGWFSPSYGLLQPALSLSAEIEALGAATFRTEFGWIEDDRQ